MNQQEALSFLLTHIVVDQNRHFNMTQFSLFELMSLAEEAVTELSNRDDVIPYELLESYASRFIEQQ